MTLRTGLASLAAAALVLSACQTTAASRTAAVDLSDPATRAAVAQALATALKRGRVDLGPTITAATSVVSVLPPPLGPYETHATAMPITFDIVWRDGQCIAVSRDKSTVARLPVDCRN